jgi:cell division control protein 6
MKDLFKDILSNEESLFTDEIALDFDYIPAVIKFREEQQAYIATCIKPLFHNRNGKNLLIMGKPGIGKTLSVKKVLEELEKETDEIIPISINCWKKDTFHKIMIEICSQIGHKWGFNKKTDEVFKEVSKILNRKKVVICFDEIDKLKEDQVLYSILEDIDKKTIILITNEINFLSKLDSRIKSRLMIDVLEFKPYNFDETKGILEYRKNFAFVNGVWDENGFNLIAEKTYELKDIRTGLFLLRESGNIAESEASRKILLKHAERAVEKLKDYKIKDSDNIGDEEKWILDFVKRNPGKSSIKIFEEYKKKYDKSLRNFQRKVKNLAEMGNLSVSEKISEKGGKVYVLDVVVKKLES